MKITNDSAAGTQKAVTNGVKRTGDKVSLSNAKGVATPTEAEDNVKVSLSDRAQDIVKAREIALNTPDVRAERVADLKEMVKAGKYKVDAGKVADRMVDASLMEL